MSENEENEISINKKGNARPHMYIHARNRQLIIKFLLSQPKHMLWVLKEPSQWESSFEHHDIR